MATASAVLREFTKPTAPHARFQSPGALPIGQALAALPCTVNGAADGTTRITAPVSLPQPPPGATGLTVCPVAADFSAGAGAPPLLKPAPWPRIETEMLLAVTPAADASATASTAAFLPSFPSTSTRANACRSFAPLDVSTHALPGASNATSLADAHASASAQARAAGRAAAIGATLTVVASNAWLAGAAAAVTGVEPQHCTLYLIVFYAKVVTGDFSAIVADVVQRQQQREEQAARKAAEPATAAAAAAAASASTDTSAVAKPASGIPPGKQLCPQDKACTKMANPTHARLFVHTCRAQGGPETCPLRNDARHTAQFVHPVVAAAAVTDAEGTAARGDDEDAAAARDAGLNRGATAAVPYDPTDPWAIRPRKTRKVKDAAAKATLSPRHQRASLSMSRTATSPKALPLAATTLSGAPRLAFDSSDDDDDDDNDAMARSGSGLFGMSSPSARPRRDGSQPMASSPSLNAASALDVVEARVPLRCPLSFRRIDLPARARRCKHDTCFDLATFIATGCRHATWNCPVCDCPAYVDELRVDAMVKEALAQLSDADYNRGVDAIVVTGSGNQRSWKFVEADDDDSDDADSLYGGDDEGQPGRPQPGRVQVPMSVSAPEIEVVEDD